MAEFEKRATPLAGILLGGLLTFTGGVVGQIVAHELSISAVEDQRQAVRRDAARAALVAVESLEPELATALHRADQVSDGRALVLSLADEMREAARPLYEFGVWADNGAQRAAGVDLYFVAIGLASTAETAVRDHSGDLKFLPAVARMQFDAYRQQLPTAVVAVRAVL